MRIKLIIILTLVRKNEDNLIVAQIGLDKKYVNVFLNSDILNTIETEEIEKELTEINMLIDR